MESQSGTPVDPLDTSRAHDAILARIRSAQHHPAQPTQDERNVAADYLAHHPVGPRPLVSADFVAYFAEQALKMTSTLDTVETLSDVPGAVARYLSGPNPRPQAVAWITLQSLDWAGAGIGAEFRSPVCEAQTDQEHEGFVGIMGCFCAIAEMGSPMLLSGPENVASTALLPETHIVVVPQSRIVINPEDACALMRTEHGELSRATNVINGPSCMGDIEQIIALGAYDPYRVHVIVVTAA